MKVDEALETIAKFFNDLIGAWVPGSVLAVGLVVIHLGPDYLQSLVKLGEGAALTLAGLLFALGHVLLAVYEHAVKPFFRLIRLSKRFGEADAMKRQSYEWFARLVNNQLGGGAITWCFKDLRSVALSVSPEAASIGRRFMFISLLCRGVGTALVILGVDYLVCLAFQSKLLHTYEQTAPWFVQAFLLFSTAHLLFKQGDAFFVRAMTTPFSVAVAELKFKKEINAIKSTP